MCRAGSPPRPPACTPRISTPCSKSWWTRRPRHSPSTGTTRSSRPPCSPATVPWSTPGSSPRAQPDRFFEENRHGTRGTGHRSVRVPLLDFRARRIRRLLRGVVGHAGAAHAADVGDQRDLVGHRGRRAACRRRPARVRRRRPAVGARARLRRARLCVSQHLRRLPRHPAQDRKSTRLNSSHVAISYAVFCLKKKKKQQDNKRKKKRKKKIGRQQT